MAGRGTSGNDRGQTLPCFQVVVPLGDKLKMIGGSRDVAQLKQGGGQIEAGLFMFRFQLQALFKSSGSLRELANRQ